MKVTFPPGCVTGVGSLPFVDGRQAVAFVARHCPVLPFWPQLPARHWREGAVVQSLGTLASSLEPASRQYCWQIRAGQQREFAVRMERGEVDLLPESAAGFFAFESAFQEGRFPDALAVKAQSEGPVTLSHCLFAEGEPLITQSRWLSRVTQFVAAQAVWQVNRLRQLGKPVLYVLDEPVMSLANFDCAAVHETEHIAAVASVLDAVRRAGAIAGLHCCAPLPARILQDLDLDYVSFDAHLPIDGEAWFDLARSVVARSGSLAFGLVPTDPQSLAKTAELFAQWLCLASATGDVANIARRTLITATCGLGLSTPAATEATFDHCHLLGRHFESFATAGCE